MFKKIRIAILKFRTMLLAFRIKRRDRRAKFFEFKTKQLVSKFYFLSSLKKDLQND